MTSNSTKLPVLGSDAEIAVGLLDEWFDPIEAGLRDPVRDFIQTMIESELEAVLSRPRYAHRPKADPENYGTCGVARHRPVTDRARFWSPLAGWRSPCRGPGSTPPRARPQNGRARRFSLTSGAPSKPIRWLPAPIWPAPTLVGFVGRSPRCLAARSAKIP